MRRLLSPEGAAVLLAVCAAFAFGAIVKVASADHFHSNCVGHGFVHGSDLTDGHFHSRVDPIACGDGSVRCSLYVFSSEIKTVYAGGSGVSCNLYVKDYGNYGPECAGKSFNHYIRYSGGGQFDGHTHNAHNNCS